jgi:hypothetical protein
MQENQDPAPAFLQNLILVRIKSQRSINHFRILHGQLLNGFNRLLHNRLVVLVYVHHNLQKFKIRCKGLYRRGVEPYEIDQNQFVERSFAGAFEESCLFGLRGVPGFQSGFSIPKGNAIRFQLSNFILQPLLPTEFRRLTLVSRFEGEGRFIANVECEDGRHNLVNTGEKTNEEKCR